jgi:hypothetical protein
LNCGYGYAPILLTTTKVTSKPTTNNPALSILACLVFGSMSRQKKAPTTTTRHIRRTKIIAFPTMRNILLYFINLSQEKTAHFNSP